MNRCRLESIEQRGAPLLIRAEEGEVRGMESDPSEKGAASEKAGRAHGHLRNRFV